MTADVRQLNADGGPINDLRSSFDIQKNFLGKKSSLIFGDSITKVLARSMKNGVHLSLNNGKPLIINEGDLLIVKPVPVSRKGKNVMMPKDILKKMEI